MGRHFGTPGIARQKLGGGPLRQVRPSDDYDRMVTHYGSFGQVRPSDTYNEMVSHQASFGPVRGGDSPQVKGRYGRFAQVRPTDDPNTLVTHHGTMGQVRPTDNPNRMVTHHHTFGQVRPTDEYNQMVSHQASFGPVRGGESAQVKGRYGQFSQVRPHDDPNTMVTHYGAFGQDITDVLPSIPDIIPDITGGAVDPSAQSATALNDRLRNAAWNYIQRINQMNRKLPLKFRREVFNNTNPDIPHNIASLFSSVVRRKEGWFATSSETGEPSERRINRLRALEAAIPAYEDMVKKYFRLAKIRVPRRTKGPALGKMAAQFRPRMVRERLLLNTSDELPRPDTNGKPLPPLPPGFKPEFPWHWVLLGGAGLLLATVVVPKLLKKKSK